MILRFYIWVQLTFLKFAYNVHPMSQSIKLSCVAELVLAILDISITGICPQDECLQAYFQLLNRKLIQLGAFIQSRLDSYQISQAALHSISFCLTCLLSTTNFVLVTSG